MKSRLAEVEKQGEDDWSDDEDDTDLSLGQACERQKRVQTTQASRIG